MVVLLTLLAWTVVGGIAAAHASGATSDGEEDVVLTLFHGEGCPHCAAELAFLTRELVPAHPGLEVRTFEVWYDEGNRALMVQAARRYGFEPGPVPVTIVDGPAEPEVIVGFGPSSPALIEAAVVRQAQAGVPASTAGAEQPPDAAVLSVPLLGEVDLSGSSALLSTLVIAFVDGVNPCSLWVLSVLLAIVLHTGSRGRVLLVGTTFLAVTAGMYALYVAGVTSALSLLDGMTWVRLTIAAVALTFGVLQLKDGLRPGVGPSLSIPVQRRPGLYARMRTVSGADRGVLATLAGTTVLAVGVSLLETPCTAGLPLLWAGLMTDQQVPTSTMVALFVVYLAVFLIDELVVFAVAVVTLRSMKLAEHHGRALKIVAGSVLVTLAVAVVAVPSAMQTVGGTLAVFGVAVLLGLAVWVVSRAVMGQERTHRVNTVPSSANDIDANAIPSGGSAGPPTAMRRALPLTSTGAMVRHSSSSSRPETRSPSSPGPPSHSSRRNP